MAKQQYEVGSDEWYAGKLRKIIDDRRERVDKVDQRLRSEEELPANQAGQNLTVFNRLRDMARLNFADQLVSTVVDRDIPKMLSSTDSEMRDRLTDLWDGSLMDAQWETLSQHRTAYGEGFITVLSPDEANPEPAFHVTGPRETSVIMDALRPGRAKYALTLGTSEDDLLETMILHGPGWFRRATLDKADRKSEWVWEAKKILSTPSCPVIPFRTRDGFGVFEKHIPTLDRINHTLLQRLVITVMQAFRQRAIQGDFSGEYPEDHPKAGQPIDWNKMFEGGPDALWLLPKDATMWESKEADIRPLIESIKSDLEQLAAATSTPLYVIAPDAANGSAAGANLSDKTFTSKITRMQTTSKAQLRHMFHIANEMSGKAPDVPGFRVMWQDEGVITLDQAQAAKSAKEGGMSHQFIAERVFGMTPMEVQAELAAMNEQRFASVLGGGA